MRTQVCIIGGGPSGLLLSQLLHRQGISSIVLEKRSRAYVLGRIRAGVLEGGTVDLLRRAGVSERLDREALIHNGTQIAAEGEMFGISFTQLTGQPVLVYGQTEVTRDLYEARDAAGGQILHEVSDTAIHDAKSAAPYVTFTQNGAPARIDCDFVAGCDGFHGICRRTIPEAARTEFERTYPFGWLGILSETPPLHEELIYASSPRGFALCSMRNPMLSRYYIQCSLSDRPEDWSDTAFWEELARRLPGDVAGNLVTGPSIEKSIAPLRSFVCEPMQWGRLFLCGDAAHIVPPTGAKGLNTAASDVHYLFEGLCQFYETGAESGLEAYSARALARVWKAVRFSWWMTNLLHQFPDQTTFDRKIQQAELAFLRQNRAAQDVLAQNYVGLPL